MNNVSSRRSLLIAIAAGSIGLISVIATPVRAQTRGGRSSIETQAVEPNPTPVLPVTTSEAASEPFERYDKLAMRGWERSLPKSRDTVISDKFGIRSALADAGIGLTVFGSNAVQYDTLQNNYRQDGPQRYNGQRFTRSITSVTLLATYDLGRIGVGDGQLIFSAFNSTHSLRQVNGPATTRIGRLAYFQSLFDDKVEFKIGYFDNFYEFLGTQTGGSFAGGALGPQASVPNEVGLSYAGFGTPAADLRVNFASHVYTKWGVQRSLPPGGATPEEKANPSGLRFHVPGTGMLTVGEVGFDRSATIDRPALWIRAGGIFNTTNFSRFDGGRSTNNWALYVAADRQLLRFDTRKPSRGIYVGVTGNYAPPRQNFVSRYIEGRVYGIGPFKTRSADLVTLVATANVYSRAGLAARTEPDQQYDKVTYALIGSYAYRVRPGLYLQPGVGAVIHPIYSPRFKAALNAYLQLSFFL
jgi:porin